MKKLLLFIIFICLGDLTNAQESNSTPILKNLPQGYPGIYITQDEKQGLEKLVQKESWAQDVLAGVHRLFHKHAERDVGDPKPTVSRLKMYWKIKATNVYVNGFDYVCADGEAAVLTVRFTGSRNSNTPYSTPKLEDMLTLMDNPGSLFLPDRILLFWNRNKVS
jgi:hypothetical protein